jgi:hypothetical protein
MYIWIVFLTLICGCSQDPPRSPADSWQQIACRDEHYTPLYRAKIPAGWLLKKVEGSLEDTTKPNCEFLIDGSIRLTVHTFPFTHSNGRIPPAAQLFRWKQQFEFLDPMRTQVTSQAHGGFTGLFLEGNGTQNGKDTAILAWSMQLGSEYNQVPPLLKADYTIKVLGPPEKIAIHRKEILQFANSFELIEELPLTL